jgi:hypothetical protein
MSEAIPFIRFEGFAVDVSLKGVDKNNVADFYLVQLRDGAESVVIKHDSAGPYVSLIVRLVDGDKRYKMRLEEE